MRYLIFELTSWLTGGPLKRAFMSIATLPCFLLLTSAWLAPSFGSIIEVGDLNIIDQLDNPSDGLRFLDMSFSDGLTLTDALTQAQATYTNARLATPSEFDDLFSAAGILYDGESKPSDGFSTGASEVISSGSNYDGGDLALLLGITHSYDNCWIWTDPDGSVDAPTTRDFVALYGSKASLLQTNSTPPSLGSLGWLLVSEAPPPVPEPAALAVWSLLGFAGVGFVTWRRRRKTA